MTNAEAIDSHRNTIIKLRREAFNEIPFDRNNACVPKQLENFTKYVCTVRDKTALRITEAAYYPIELDRPQLRNLSLHEFPGPSNAYVMRCDNHVMCVLNTATFTMPLSEARLMNYFEQVHYDRDRGTSVMLTKVKRLDDSTASVTCASISWMSTNKFFHKLLSYDTDSCESIRRFYSTVDKYVCEPDIDTEGYNIPDED